MKRLYALVWGLILPWALSAQTTPLPRCTPEEQGVPSQAVLNLLDSLMEFEHTDLHTLLITRNGHVIAEAHPAPFHSGSAQQMYSCSKTFTGLAVGLAVADNLLRLDDRMAVFFPELLPAAVSDSLASVTVRDLLTMQSGVKVDWGMRGKRDDWTRGFLSLPMVDAPGRRFGYDSMSSYMLAAIVQRATGRTVFDYLDERIFRPMEITDARWELSPEGVNCGGWGVWMQPESLAKIGQLFLQEGRWNDRQLVPAEWIKDMSAMKVKQDSPTLDDYCYQMWTCRRPGTSRLDGALGQFVFIVPDLQMVVVVTQSFTGNGAQAQREQSWLWDGLMPAVADGPLPPSKDYNRLLRAVNNASLPMPAGKKSSPKAALISGKTYELEGNILGWEAVGFELGSAEPALTVTDKSGQTTVLPLGYKKWLTSPIKYAPANSLHSVRGALDGLDADFEASAAYAWTAPDTLVIKIYYTNWGSATTLTVKVDKAGQPTLEALNSFALKSPIALKIKD